MRPTRPLLALLALAATACGNASGPPASGRVLLVGIDAASLRVVRPLLREGRLPNLARLAEEGVHGPLQSFLPLQSPRIWATIATGKVPEKHGILSFAHTQNDGSQALYLSTDRKVHALWNVTSDAGLPTAVVNWWTTFPPARIHGIVVTEHFFVGDIDERRRFFMTVAGPRAPTIHPPQFEERALAALREPGALAGLPNPLAALERFPDWHKGVDVFDDDNEVAKVALAVEQELSPSLLMVFFPGIDRLSHMLWATFEPPDRVPAHLRPPPEARKVGRAALLGYYEHMDRLLGLLLERYGPQDLVLVVSDHGFELHETVLTLDDQKAVLPGNHMTEQASRGLLFARGPGIRRGAEVAGTSVNDVTPTVLAWLGLPLGADMDGRPAAFLERTPPPPIASYDSKPIERVASDSRGAEQGRLEQLRALGYVE